LVHARFSFRSRFWSPTRSRGAAHIDIGFRVEWGVSDSTDNSKPAFVMERYGRLHEMDRSFDIEYWQRLGPEAIMEAAWQLVVDAHLARGGTMDELRLQRTVEHFQRTRG
jgi:hypothetical protein